MKKDKTIQSLLFENDSDVWDELIDDGGMKDKRKELFFSQLKNIQQYNKTVFRDQSLKEVAKKLTVISKLAEEIILNEQDDWFDKITLKNDTKHLMNSCVLFEQTAKEISTLEFRMTSSYEDIMQKLNKYFNIDSDNELTEFDLK